MTVLITKSVWPGIVVSEENFKVQISALCKALGADRDVIHTEVGRGYRFIGMLRSNAAANGYRHPTRARLRRLPPPFPRPHAREG
jgi:DNA-binding winged helix-turn-helix (wHTH) protein